MRTPQVAAPWSKHGAEEYKNMKHETSVLLRYARAYYHLNTTDQRTKEGRYWYKEWVNSWNCLSEQMRQEIKRAND